METANPIETQKTKNFMLYGATGYTGCLTLDLYFQRGGDKEQIVIAGRNLPALTALSQKHGVVYRVFDLKNPEIIDQNIRDVRTVLHMVNDSQHAVY
jgi:short subunit dehydrogenase-like uncharacterized protein